MILQIQDIIKDAMGLINALDADETPTSSEIQLGIRTANIMLDSWSAKHLMLRSVTTDSLAVQAGVSAYPIGPGALWNTTKPLNISSAFLRDAAGVDYPIDVITLDEYQGYIDKSFVASRPVSVYYDPGFAQQNTTPSTLPAAYDSLTTYASGDYVTYSGNLYVSLISANLGNTPSASPASWLIQNSNYGTAYLYYIPDSSYTMFLSSDKYLKEFSTPTDTVTLEPMYYEAMIYNLAPRLWRHYKKPADQVPADILRIGRESMACIENTNSKQVIAGMEMPGQVSSFNIYSGDYVE